jgi:hypothetical protein
LAWASLGDSLTQMNQDDQLQQLCALYAEKRDAQLQEMYAQREDLTEVAERALEQVMRSRNLVPLTQAPESPAGDPVQAGASPTLNADEVDVWTSTDAFEAGEALRLLTEAGFSPRAVNWNDLNPEAEERRPPVNLGIVVRRSEAHAAQKLLGERMGLFPTGEVDDPFAELTGMMQVGRFVREDALVVAATLGQAGISFVWHDDRDDLQATTDDVSVEVKGEKLERAQELVEQRLSD